jgi:hypothetical protein
MCCVALPPLTPMNEFLTKDASPFQKPPATGSLATTTCSHKADGARLAPAWIRCTRQLLTPSPGGLPADVRHGASGSSPLATHARQTAYANLANYRLMQPERRSNKFVIRWHTLSQLPAAPANQPRWPCLTIGFSLLTAPPAPPAARMSNCRSPPARPGPTPARKPARSRCPGVSRWWPTPRLPRPAGCQS